MHIDSVLDDLVLVVKLATSSRTSHRETPRSNKNRDMQSMQRLSSLTRRDQVTQPEAPLDSAAIYPITRSPNNHLETGERKKTSNAIPLPCASRLILMMMPHASIKPERLT